MTWVYEIQVLGRVSDEALLQLRSDFAGVAATHQPACTLLKGSVADQAALIGLVDVLEALGIQVRELRRGADQPTRPAASPQAPEGR